MAYKYKQGVKIALTKSRTIIILIVALAVLSGSLYYLYAPRPITAINYHGIIISFRVDLREANKIPIDQASVEKLVWGDKLKRMAIAFLNTSDVGLVGVEAFEITNKLTIAYLTNGTAVTTQDVTEIPSNYIQLKAIPLNSFEELNTSEFDMVIFLIPPSIATETSVKVKDNIISIQGKNSKEFDLATTKFLMAALRIKI